MINKAAVATICMLIVFGIASVAHAETIIHKERSLYRDITVYEEEGTRCMRFTRIFSARQSCVSLNDRDHLVMNYTKMMLGALYLCPNPQDFNHWGWRRYVADNVIFDFSNHGDSCGGNRSGGYNRCQKIFRF
jgi:hypothetical protein